MAIINLPDSQVWDTEKTEGEQTEEAQQWFRDTLATGENVSLLEEEYCGDDLDSNPVNRPTKRVYESTGVNIELDIVYVHAANDRRCGAVKSRTYNVIEI